LAEAKERQKKEELEKKKLELERKQEAKNKTVGNVYKSSATEEPKASPSMTDEVYSPQRTGERGGKMGNAWQQKMAEKAIEEKKEERNKIRGRRGKAVAYMDNQIRTVLSMLKQNGGSMTYGDLFVKTQDSFDALSAILNAGKKRGVLDYNSASLLLMQGSDDGVVITLIKEDLPDSDVFHTQAFDKEEVLQVLNQSKGPEKCVICNKVVYPTERIAPNSKVMHKSCFKCKECGSGLRLDGYCLNNNNFYCKSDYERMKKALGGGYKFWGGF